MVEDDATVRGVVEILLATEPDLELVGVATTAEEALELVSALMPDLVLLDNQLEGPMTGLEAAPELKQRSPATLVLLCSALDLPGVEQAPAVDGYLRKDRLVDLVDEVRAVLAGGGRAQP